MIIVKIFKIVFLIFLSFFLIIAAVLMQINSTITNVLFSDKYFNRTFDENLKPENIEELIRNIVENAEKLVPMGDENNQVYGDESGHALNEGEISPELKNMIESYKDMLQKSNITQWLSTEIPKVIKGFFGYFTGNNESIPLIYIKPMKDLYIEMFTEQISTHSGAIPEKDIDNVIRKMKKVSGGILTNGKANEKAIDVLMAADMFKSMGLSRESAGMIVEKIGNMELEDTGGKEIFDFIIKIFVEEKTGTNSMKNELDLNLLFDTIYGSDSNPVAAAKIVVNEVRNRIYSINIIIFGILLFIIILLTFYPSGILRWSGTILILSGVICLIPAALYRLVIDMINNEFTKIQSNLREMDLFFIRDWVQSYIGGIVKFLIMQAAIIFVIGIVIIIISFFMPSTKSIKDKIYMTKPDGKISLYKRKGFIQTIRTVVIILLMVFLPLSIVKYSRLVSYEITAFNEISERSYDRKDKVSTNEALDKVLDTKLFESMSGNGNEADLNK